MPPRSYQVRVIAGVLKGRALRYPPGTRLRPTMQRTKSSVFETLGGRLDGAIFVDLYAGAGSMGIEALSRGAHTAWMVENDERALRCLHENIERLALGSRAIVVASEVRDFLADALPRTDADIIFADPPYESHDAELLLEFFDSVSYSRSRLIVMEHDRDLRMPEFSRLERIRQRAFGRTTISYFENTGDGS